MISLNAVERSHGSRTLFRDVSLRINAGRRMALVGPNGAGKTTLLDIITGDQQPDAGEVARQNVGVSSCDVKRRASAHPQMTAQEPMRTNPSR